MNGINKVIIADMYQCPYLDGKYDKQNKILKRKGAKVTREYVEKINEQHNGLLYVIDEKATAANQAERAEKNGVRLDKKQRKEVLKDTGLVDKLIDRAVGNKVTAEVIEPKKPKLEDLRKQYPHIKARSVDAFLVKIKEAEEEESTISEETGLENDNQGERKTDRPEDDIL